MERVTSFVGVFLLLGVLAGCGDGGPGTSTSNNSNTCCATGTGRAA